MIFPATSTFQDFLVFLGYFQFFSSNFGIYFSICFGQISDFFGNFQVIWLSDADDDDDDADDKDDDDNDDDADVDDDESRGNLQESQLWCLGGTASMLSEEKLVLSSS